MAEVTEPLVETNGRIKVQPIAVYVVLMLLSASATGLVAYFKGAADQQSAIAVLQVQVTQLKMEVDELRSDVKTLLERH